MPRDLDFKPRQPQPAPNYQRRSVESPKRKTQKGKWWLLLVLVGLTMVGYAVYLQSQKTDTAAPVAKQPSENQVQQKIQVYDGGAGETEAEELVDLLKDAGYLAEYAGKTLDNYEGAVIWYASGQNELAQAVAGKITGQTNTQESQITQGYAVQVFLGN